MDRHFTQRPNIAKWRELPIHQYAKLMPEPTEEDEQNLRDDIRSHGVRVPILVWIDPEKPQDGLQILDGRSRYLIGRELGAEIPVVEFHGTHSEALKLVASYNFHRRHFNPSQRGIAAERLARWLMKADTLSQKEADANALKQTGASHRYLGAARRIRKDAPKVADAIMAGKKTIGEYESEQAAKRAEATRPKKPDPVQCPCCGCNLLKEARRLSPEDARRLREHLRGI